MDMLRYLVGGGIAFLGVCFIWGMVELAIKAWGDDDE